MEGEARHFRVSPRFVNNMMILQRTSGSLAAGRQGHPPGTKLSGHSEWISERVALHGEVTLDELCVELAGRGIEVHRRNRRALLHRLELSNKKSLKASEQRRPEIARVRDLWFDRRKRFFNKALSHLIFIDETSTNTRLTKRTGWSAKGDRLNAYVPFGKWKTQTFIAGLRCHGLTAPWIVDAPMNSHIFQTWIDTQLSIPDQNSPTVPFESSPVCVAAGLPERAPEHRLRVITDTALDGRERNGGDKTRGDSHDLGFASTRLVGVSDC